MNRVREALRGTAEFTLGRGLVARAAESVAWPNPSGEDGGDDAFLATVEVLEQSMLHTGSKRTRCWSCERASCCARRCSVAR